jgi:hypothetical protein
MRLRRAAPPATTAGRYHLPRRRQPSLPFYSLLLLPFLPTPPTPPRLVSSPRARRRRYLPPLPASSIAAIRRLHCAPRSTLPRRQLLGLVPPALNLDLGGWAQRRWALPSRRRSDVSVDTPCPAIWAVGGRVPGLSPAWSPPLLDQGQLSNSAPVSGRSPGAVPVAPAPDPTVLDAGTACVGTETAVQAGARRRGPSGGVT